MENDKGAPIGIAVRFLAALWLLAVLALGIGHVPLLLLMD